MSCIKHEDGATVAVTVVVGMWSTGTIEAEGVAEPVMVAVALVRRYL